MTYMWIVLGALIVFIVCPSVLIYLYLTRSNYKERYNQCVAEIDEVLLDVYRATKMIPGMDEIDPMQVNAIVVQTIMVNYLVQRVFTKAGVLYLKETSSKWIQGRLDIVKQSQIK